ncbi:MAG: HDOD domain-containing protein [Methylophagaceae bacterium]
MKINIEKLVSEISGLVSLPDIYMKIRSLIDDPSSDLDDFAPVVTVDPALTASVLRIVNSAFFGFPGKIDNLNRALNLIGIGQLHDLVLSLSAVEALELPNEIEPLKVFWKRSIFSGSLAKLLAKNCKLADAESLFVIGLLHEIGHLVLFTKYAEQCKSAVIQAQDEDLPLVDAERAIFGTDYAKIGQALMSAWNLPHKFHCVTGGHCEPNKALEYVQDTMIVHIAHKAAVNRYPGADSYQYEFEQEELDAIKINEDDLNLLCQEAHDISLEMEKVILGD